MGDMRMVKMTISSIERGELAVDRAITNIDHKSHIEPGNKSKP